ncbi:MAG: hypothetical protein LBV43_08245 [Prevotella sp.]|jgi:hypothetical protein|nr:hypothetical protein [Prevotella sp.]
MRHIIKYIFSFIGLTVLVSCSTKIDTYSTKNQDAKIYPVYESTVIPYNIAPPNFQIREKGDKYIVRFVANADSFEVSTGKNADIPLKKWKSLLEKNKGGVVQVKIFSKEEGGWVKYNNIEFAIANEPIDPYVAYRLIEPGYELWNRMSIYQRCVENFEESPIMENSLTEKNCMNCHSFCKNDPETMLFHMRAQYGGTLIARGNDIKKVDPRTSWMPSGAVYPRWHPEGRFIAFSTNNTAQGFLSAHTNKVEVFDLESDIVIYDTQENRTYTNDLICSKGSFETFPEWSPDGRYLYFCSAPALKMPNEYKELKYDLLRIAFDPETSTFGNKVDTLVSAIKTGQSVSIPRISPDGKSLVFCLSNFGTFPIWHRENDLYLLDLESGEMNNMKEANSSESDSYHSWSSNGRWLVFGSRRFDGNYTRLYISYVDEQGNDHKAFLLPQKDPEHYDYQMKSYNIPECITGKVKISPYDFYDAAKGEALAAKGN